MKKLNWGIVSQVLVAASVVLSLILVAYEIRQNTSVAKVAAAQAFTQQIIDINAIIVSGDMPELNARLIAGEHRNEFTEDEQFMLDINLLSLIRVWESTYRAVRAGIVDEEILVPLGKRGVTPFFTPYFTKSWDTYRLNFTADFVTFFEGELPHLK